MRTALLLVLVVSSGCGRSGAALHGTVSPVPPPSTVTAPASSTAASAGMASGGPTPPAEPEGPCSPGALVDMAKIHDKIEGSFSRPGVHEIVATVSCEPGGADVGARVLARRDEKGVFRVARADALEARSTISKCQVLSTSEGRDLAICERSFVSYGLVSVEVVVLDYTKDPGDDVSALVGVVDTTDTACQGRQDLVVGQLVKVERVDVDGDGHDDVRVTLREAGFHVPKQPPCKSLGFAGSGQPPRDVPRPPLQTVDFIAHGAVLTPTAAAVRILKALEKLRPP